MNFPRRKFLQFAGAAAIAPAFLRGASRAAPSLSIAPQPYFANVKRAIDALATLGAPIGAADAARIAALSRAPMPPPSTQPNKYSTVTRWRD